MYSQNMNYAYGFHAEQQSVDPNSSEAFKQNLRIVQQQVATLREHARRALAGMYVQWQMVEGRSLIYHPSHNAYHVGGNPSQTQQDIVAAKQILDAIIDLMQRSGVGALPLLGTDASGQAEVPTEDNLVETATKGVQANFEKLKRAQESAAVVANLLGTERRPQKP